ncbi:terpenoid cyclases/protein prenyltransferase alpha-alpha toroid, partial [Infundibulicybe gibba]
LPELPTPQTPLDAARNGYTFYKNLQSHDGHWPGEYGGPMFLIPGLVIGSYERLEIIRYLMNRAHPEDGGWGIHVEGHSTVFGTALNYTVLRVLGVDAEHPVCVKARATLHKLGGAAAIPAWGKFWLSVLNVYEWEGNNPIPPELWSAPAGLGPIPPHRWWIHTRTVYVPMSYLYAVRFKGPELYTDDYYSIYWPAQRNNVCKADLYSPHTALFDFINVILAAYEQCIIPPLHPWPVSKMINLIARAHREGPESEAYKQHEIKRHDFMWMAKKTGLAHDADNKESLLKALEWLDESQIRDDPKHYHTSYRHTTKGAWGFSTKEQGYTVSDCTGEGLKAVMYLQNHLDFTPKPVSERRMCDAVDVMLTLQNPNGGFASYELWLNPAEVFGDIMTEYCYPECTTSVITSLAIFRKHYPHYRSDDIERTIKHAINYLHDAQKPEGGWVGSWGICFTYATQFALESLSLVGETYETSEHLDAHAISYSGSSERMGAGGELQIAWVDHENTQIIQTCWAVMALMYARYPHPEPIRQGVELVMSRQNPDGSWPQEAIEGVFNKTCAIAYPNFKFSFPIWMLGKAHRYLAELKARPAPKH